MGSNLEFYKKFFQMAWANPPASVIEANEKYLSDDFKNFDKEGNVVMDKKGYIGMNRLLASAIKDLNAVYGELREEGDDVIASFHFEGTHTGDLDLSAMGMGVIPASGKKIIWPESTAVFKIRDGKIISISPYGDSGGIEDFLEPLGVKLPAS